MALDEETVRRRYREFLELMPVTISIAGLADSQGPMNYSADQMEVRAHTVATAFRLARQMVREIVSSGG